MGSLIRRITAGVIAVGLVSAAGCVSAAASPGSSGSAEIDDVVPAPPLPPGLVPAGKDNAGNAGLWQAMLSPPAGDPIFDHWPDGLADRLPGEIIEWRDVTATAAPLVVVPIRQALLLKFRSTDSKGAPSYGTATLVIPEAEWTGDGTRPVVVNNLPINSLGRKCTPGYAMAHGLHEKFSTGDLFPPTTGWAVDRGFAVLIPDHEGPLMAYGEPVVAGHAVLDAIRATRNHLPGEFGDSRFAVSGYSGGAIATYGAAMLLGEYAPDLSDTVVGTAMGGLISDYRSIAHRFNGGPAAGILMAAGLAISREHPEFLPHLNHLAQWVATSPIKDTCGDGNGPLGVLQLPVDVGLNLEKPFESGVLNDYFEHADLSGRTAVAPMYLYHGLLEFAVPIEQSRKLMAQQCARGVPVSMTEMLGEHLLTMFGGWPGSMAWMEQRLLGVAAPDDCGAAGTGSASGSGG